ncbi:MAG: hypothetical protein PHW69_04145 [Elusimicrobiaceae bacterium]|nr:hypothetical protein [Elusimicrobiaceae bacterium]
MKKLLKRLDELALSAERIPGLFYALLFSAVFLLCRDGLVVGFTGLGAKILRAVPNEFGSLVREGGFVPALLLTFVKTHSESSLLSIRSLLLAVHAANVLAFYAVARGLFGFGARLGLAAAAVFAFSPVNTVAALQPLNLGVELAVFIALAGALIYARARYKGVLLFCGAAALLCSSAGVMVFVLFPLLPAIEGGSKGGSGMDLRTGLRYIGVWAAALALLQAARLVYSLDVIGFFEFLKRLMGGFALSLPAALWPPVSTLLFPSVSVIARVAGVLTALAALAAVTAGVCKDRAQRPLLLVPLAFLVSYATGWTCGPNPEIEVFSYYGVAAAVALPVFLWLRDLFLQRGLSRVVRPVCAGMLAVFLIYSAMAFGSAGDVFFNESKYLASLCGQYPFRDNCNSYAAEQINDGKTEQALRVLLDSRGSLGSRAARFDTVILTGQAYLLSGHYAKAEKYFRGALNRMPDDVSAAEGLAFLYKRRKLYGNSVAVLDGSMAAGSAGPDLLYRKGLVLLEARNYDAGFAALRSACGLNSDYCLFR